MRDKKKRTVDIEIPADFQGSLQQEFSIDVRPVLGPAEPLPAAVPLPREVVAPIIVDVTS